mmetsp:Transcript_30728/g.67875  ORF Transcript_30728/g.67875 Transcript_30728/m.67875 type:complete len:235 (-) Transcript_30728:1450-2154(-)
MITRFLATGVELGAPGEGGLGGEPSCSTLRRENICPNPPSSSKRLSPSIEKMKCRCTADSASPRHCHCTPTVTAAVPTAPAPGAPLGKACSVIVISPSHMSFSLSHRPFRLTPKPPTTASLAVSVFPSLSTAGNNTAACLHRPPGRSPVCCTFSSQVGPCRCNTSRTRISLKYSFSPAHPPNTTIYLSSTNAAVNEYLPPPGMDGSWDQVSVLRSNCQQSLRAPSAELPPMMMN